MLSWRKRPYEDETVEIQGPGCEGVCCFSVLCCGDRACEPTGALLMEGAKTDAGFRGSRYDHSSHSHL